MKPTSTQLKSTAKGKLMGNYPICMGLFILTLLFSLIGDIILRFLLPDQGSFSILIYLMAVIVISLFMTIFSGGCCYFYLNLCRGKNTNIGDLFFGFQHCPDRIIIISLLLFLMELACMLPAIPGIIIFVLAPNNPIAVLVFVLLFIVSAVLSFLVLLNYSLVYYLYADHPHISSLEILRLSKTMMKGNKGRCFYLTISFIGLLLLSVFTCFIGLLWLVPYISTTFCEFYLDLNGGSKEPQANPSASPKQV